MKALLIDVMLVHVCTSRTRLKSGEYIGRDGQNKETFTKEPAVLVEIMSSKALGQHFLQEPTYDVVMTARIDIILLETLGGL